MSKPQGFPKSLRLRARKEIDLVFRRGRYHRLGILQAKTMRTERKGSRFMVSVRKAVGNAPQRNRIKRVVREAIRRNAPALSTSHDICLFMTSVPQQPVGLSTVENEIRTLFDRLGPEGQNPQSVD
jgi:ribonuclease P protein component